MKIKRLSCLIFISVIGSVWALGHGNWAVVSADPLTTIGTGTPASCQSNAAVTAFSNAVAAGGVIDFDCGPDPVTIAVNTSTTDQQTIIEGGGLITLDGEDLRQIFRVMAGGHLTMNDLSLVNGYASYEGGAIYIQEESSAIINGSFISSSEAFESGGGILSNGILTITQSTISNNVAALYGGGIYNNGFLTIEDSYLTSNQSLDGGGIYTFFGLLTVDRSAVRSNVAANEGGGIFVDGATQITNSTFSNNQAVQGGALFLEDQDTNILNATFNENRADTGGAIWKGAASSATLKNSIVAGSLDTGGNIPSLNCDGPPLISQGRNIISDDTCVPNPGANGDLFSTDPQLGIWNPSPLRAYIPGATSPAIDYGLDCPAIDQRGYPRPLGLACDVGSIERGPSVFMPAVIR